MSLEVIGRDRELALLAQFLNEPHELPASLILAGEPGIGKTTLWRAGVDAAGERSLRVLTASPVEAETKLSFAALGDLLANALGDMLPALAVPQRRALEIALLLEEGEATYRDQRTLGVAVVNGLRALAEAGPLLVAIDDVQWLDPSSASVLAFALRRLDTPHVALLLAQRLEDEAPAPLGLDRAFEPARLRRLRVGPISLGATHRLLSDRLGAVFPRPILRRLHELSAGNPFFVLELGRALEGLERRLDPGRPLPVPDNLRRLVAQRLARLPGATQESLTVAAALSQPSAPMIAAAIEDDAYLRLGPALEAHIVELHDERVRFTHPLLASASYESASPRRRRELHRKLARLVPDLEEQAHHLALAAEGPDEEVAVALEEASGRAFGRGAPDAAADLCAQARLLTPAGDWEAVRRRSLQEAEYAMESGDTPRARAVLDDVLSASPGGHARAEALICLARVHFNGLDWTTSARLLEQASLDAGGDPALQAQIELHLALNLDLLRTDVSAALAHARAAVGLAEHLGEAAVLAEALALEAKSEFLLGRPWPQAIIERGLALEPAMAALAPDRWPSDYLASMLAWTDDLDSAVARLETVRRVALERGDEVSVVWTLFRMGEAKCYRGALQEACRDIERGYEIALQAGQIANQAILLATRALAEAHLGSTEPARHAGERAIELAERSGAVMARRIALAALGFLELSLGRPAEAHERLGPLVEETRAAGIGEPGAMRFLQDEIEALVNLGRTSEAEELLGFLEERAEATGRASALAAAYRSRGLLAVHAGEFESALTALHEALRHHERAAMPLDRSRTLLALGKVQRRAKRKRAARESLEDALRTFQQLGAGLWAERTRAELARIGGRTPVGDELTSAERRLAELVAEGLSNKQIAATLFVTPKTVSTKLSRMYAKLDVHSRTELVRHLAERSAGKV